MTVFGSDLAKTEGGLVEKELSEYLSYLNDAKLIAERLERTERKLEPYKEYLE